VSNISETTIASLSTANVSICEAKFEAYSGDNSEVTSLKEK